MSEKRPSWDEYFLEIMRVTGLRSTCDRGYVGSVITRDNRILATGYAGSPRGAAHCSEVGHEMHSVRHSDGTITEHCIRTVHAEQNALITAARHGISTLGATVYCKMTPCYTCAKLLVNAGVSRIVVANDYHASKRSKELFNEVGISLEIINLEVEKY